MSVLCRRSLIKLQLQCTSYRLDDDRLSIGSLLSASPAKCQWRVEYCRVYNCAKITSKRTGKDYKRSVATSNAFDMYALSISACTRKETYKSTLHKCQRVDWRVFEEAQGEKNKKKAPLLSITCVSARTRY